ncbi:hypothetical protein M1394_02730, partial [Candidatus Marsarchaeota archaeon]|nr:hypothetical protein [Candidatus Marsarchaeota archaeon]
CLLASRVTGAAELMSKLIGSEINRAISSQNILIKIVVRIMGKKAEDAISPYIAAVVLLVSSARSVSPEKVGDLLKAIGIEPQKRELDFVSMIRFDSATAAYAPVFYFMTLVKDEPNAESLMVVIKALGLEANKETADYVMKIYRENILSKEVQKPNKLQEMLDASIKSASDMLSKLELMELERIFEIKNMKTYIEEGIIPYLGAVGVMEYMGRDIGLEGTESFRSGVKEVIEAIGAVPDDKMLDVVTKSLNIGNFPFIYVSAIFFILGAGQEPNVQKMIDVVRTMGLKTDEAAASYLLTLYQQMNPRSNGTN